MKETLSDKIVKRKVIYRESSAKYPNYLKEEDVREFIKKLKEEFSHFVLHDDLNTNDKVSCVINKLAGEELANHSPQTKRTVQKGSGDVLREDSKRSDESLKVKTEDTQKGYGKDVLNKVYQCGQCGKLHKKKDNKCCGDFELEKSYQCLKCGMLFDEDFEHECPDCDRIGLREVGK